MKSNKKDKNNVLKELYTQYLESCFSVISGRFVYQTGKNKWVTTTKKIK